MTKDSTHSQTLGSVRFANQLPIDCAKSDTKWTWANRPQTQSQRCAPRARTTRGFESVFWFVKSNRISTLFVFGHESSGARQASSGALSFSAEKDAIANSEPKLKVCVVFPRVKNKGQHTKKIQALFGITSLRSPFATLTPSSNRSICNFLCLNTVQINSMPGILDTPCDPTFIPFCHRARGDF